MNLKKKSKLNKIFALKYFFYDFVKWTGAIPTLLFIRPRVKHIDKESRKKLRGGFIISGNHLQFLDPIIVMCAFSFRRVLFVAMEKMFDSPLKSWFFRSIRCIKVNRNNVGIETIRSAGEVLGEEKVLCIFPEGKIGHGIDSAEFKPGCAMISILNNVPIVPVYLEKRKSFRRCTKVIMGKPIYPNEVVGDSKSVAAIEKLNKYLYEKEQELSEYYKSIQKG